MKSAYSKDVFDHLRYIIANESIALLNQKRLHWANATTSKYGNVLKTTTHGRTFVTEAIVKIFNKLDRNLDISAKFPWNSCQLILNAAFGPWLIAKSRSPNPGSDKKFMVLDFRRFQWEFKSGTALRLAYPKNNVFGYREHDSPFT